MKTIIQNYKTGELKEIKERPPKIKVKRVLVKTSYSLISAGTEKTKIDMGKKNLIEKARSRPDLVKKVLEKAKKDGLWKTWQTVSQRLSTPITLGYSCSGVVLEVGEGVEGIKRGDLVACGGSFANHAEIVSIPKNLVVSIPEGVEVDQAAFTTIGAIAMQGVRQADVRIGEKVAVIGLGLIGLLVVQILKASGCQTIGMDVDSEKVSLSKKLGCDEAVLIDDNNFEEVVLLFTNGYGVDSTIITAGTQSNGPIEQAGEITREKGRVVVVGAVGMNIPREPYYLKEIDFRISRSYGPGRYDDNYEIKGHDYPFAYVRFTEQRNMECFLSLIKNKQIDITPLITHRFTIDNAYKGYELIEGDKTEPYLGILLEYSREEIEIPAKINLRPINPLKGKIIVGVIGAGNYATSNLLPYLKANPDIAMGTICTATGVTAIDVAKQFGFQSANSDVDQIITESDAVLIATRHSDHASYTIKALNKNKSVFVEKPLVIKEEELEEFISMSLNGFQGSLMVGFNRRFSPAVELVKEHFQSSTGQKQVLIRINAGNIPMDHWIQDPDVGGGRLIGEACHFVDLIVSLTGSLVETVSSTAIPKKGIPAVLWDNFSITLGMADGSVGCIVYTSIGDPSMPKEYIEVFCENKVGVINDFDSVDLWDNNKRKRKKWFNKDKGQQKQIEAWVKGMQKGESPISIDEIINVHKACIYAVKSIRNREMIII